MEKNSNEFGRIEGFDTQTEAEVARDNILNLLFARYERETLFDLSEVNDIWRLRLHDGDASAKTILFHEGYLSDDEVTRDLTRQIFTYGQKRCHYHYDDVNQKIYLKGKDKTVTLAAYDDQEAVFGPQPTSEAEAGAVVNQIINFLLVHFGRSPLFDVGPLLVDGDEIHWRLRLNAPGGNTLMTSVREENDNDSVLDRALAIKEGLFLSQITGPIGGTYFLELKDQGDTKVIARSDELNSAEDAEALKVSLHNLLFWYYHRKGFWELNENDLTLKLYDSLETHTPDHQLLDIPSSYPWNELPHLLRLGTDIDQYELVENAPNWNWEISPLGLTSHLAYTSKEDAKKAALAASLFFTEHFGQKAFFEMGALGDHWRLLLKDRTGKLLLHSHSTLTDEAGLYSAIDQIIHLGVAGPNYCYDKDSGAVTLGVIKTGANEPCKPCNEKMDIIAYLSNFYTDRTTALDDIDEAVQFISEAYSGEGFHMIEHLHLRPTIEDPCDPDSLLDQEKWEQFLAIPGKNGTPIRDPYSFQVSFILPNGCKRDAQAGTDELMPFLPNIFLDEDYRDFVERAIRRETPAHILPHIVWIPSEQNYGIDKVGNPVTLEKFERLYRKWLIIKEETATLGRTSVRVVDDFDKNRIQVQNELVQMLNLMYSGG